MFTQIFQNRINKMKNFHNEEIYIKKDNFSDNIFKENRVFFDIETTGFSPVRSIVYMIGCARRVKNRIIIDQYFAQSSDDEAAVITAFTDSIADCDALISFNGVGFDMPFLRAKCQKFNIDDPFAGKNIIDIFKEITPIKPLLGLENYKQKTVERFLGIEREDKYTGGELINVYYEYLATHSDEQLHLLQTHNYEDVLGMAELLPVLAYKEVLCDLSEITDITVSPFTAYDGQPKKELVISFRNKYAVPKPLSIHDNDFYINIGTEKTSVRIEVLEGELKHFYSDYKNYYYLPKEDMAIHKSVATFVDNQYRERCKAYNCYVRKSGEFIVQHELIMQPEFRNDIKDKHSYFLLTDDFINEKQMVISYAKHIINHLFKF